MTFHDTVLDYVQHVVGRAARDAADFKLRDPASITTVSDCIPDNFAAWAAPRIDRLPALVRDVQAALETIGYRTTH